MAKWIDPPGGWRWGFPKIMPNNVENFRDWLVQEGYPQSEIDALGSHFYVRMWEEETPQ